jgi:hypothetical protein
LLFYLLNLFHGDDEFLVYFPSDSSVNSKAVRAVTISGCQSVTRCQNISVCLGIELFSPGNSGRKKRGGGSLNSRDDIPFYISFFQDAVREGYLSHYWLMPGPFLSSHFSSMVIPVFFFKSRLVNLNCVFRVINLRVICLKLCF